MLHYTDDGKRHALNIHSFPQGVLVAKQTLLESVAQKNHPPLELHIKLVYHSAAHLRDMIANDLEVGGDAAEVIADHVGAVLQFDSVLHMFAGYFLQFRHGRLEVGDVVGLERQVAPLGEALVRYRGRAGPEYDNILTETLAVDRELLVETFSESEEKHD